MGTERAGGRAEAPGAIRRGDARTCQGTQSRFYRGVCPRLRFTAKMRAATTARWERLFPSFMQFEHGFDFHGDVVRQRSHTDGAAGSFSGFAEDFHHGVTEPVHHSWVALEVGS